MPILEPLDKEELSKLPAEERFKKISERSKILIFVQIFGAIAGLIVVYWFFADSFEKLFGYSIKFRMGELNLFISYAYAAENTPIPGSGILKSVILAGIFLALFVLFIWSLITLYKSPNATAVGVAAESAKTLGGFFIGALTGFLGSP
jgi:hypothetical protein